MSKSNDEQPKKNGNASSETKSGGGILPIVALIAGVLGIGGAGIVYNQVQALQNNLGSSLNDSTNKFETALNELGSNTNGMKQAITSELSSVKESVTTQISTLTESVDQKLQSTKEDINSTSEALSGSVNQQLETVVGDMNSKIDASVESMQTSIQETQMLINSNQRDWIMAEIEYLLRMAKHRVALAADVESSIQALKSADRQLAELNEIDLLPVRQQIAEEIAELRDESQPDIEGLIFSLSRLARSAETLPTPKIEEPSSEEITQASNEFSFSGFLDQFAVKDDKSLNSSLIGTATDEQLESSEIIRLHLQASQLAAVRRDQSAFADHIQLALTQTQQLYDIKDPRVRGFVNDLSEIAESPVNPIADKLGRSLHLLNEINAKLGV